MSLTITEGGYVVDGASPTGAFGLITAGLARRRAAGLAPFTIVSCDNLQGNGELARRVFSEFARRLDPELGAWIEHDVDFPSSMVDRITPATTDQDPGERRGALWNRRCVAGPRREPFTQWVLEDSFVSGRPPFEEAGVQVVDDVTPYELMKLRLLNASHQGLCYFGRLCDYVYVHEAAQDPLFRRFLRGYIDDEATPTLAPVPGVDLRQYKGTL